MSLAIGKVLPYDFIATSLIIYQWSSFEHDFLCIQLLCMLILTNRLQSLYRSIGPFLKYTFSLIFVVL